jgi:radical SAM protein with 4Fe4S-binding SPASM domain
MFEIKKNLDFRSPSYEFPQEIQIQTVSYCNARCIMCPYSMVYQRIPHGAITEKHYKRLLDECAEYSQYIKNFKPFLMNEPLIDKRLMSFVKYARIKLPQTKIGFSTNGFLLEGNTVNELINCGIDELYFNFSGNSEKTYKQVMIGLDYSIVKRNILNFKDQCVKKNSNILIKISMVETKPIISEIEESKNYWAKNDIIVETIPFNNRGGNIVNNSIKLLENEVSYRTCDRPFYKMYITFDGKVIQCSSDWERRNIMGDVYFKSIYKVWHNKKFQALRYSITKNPRSNNLCQQCDYLATY